MTDEEGKFALSGLDPGLLFELLVVAQDHTPTYTEKDTDPKLGPVAIELAPRRLVDEPSERVLRGKVVDAHGDPIRRAALVPIGWQHDGGITLGAIGADPLAVTDEHGEFAFLVREPGMVVQCQVSASAYAERMSDWWTAGAGGNTVTLDRGTTVTGRVLRDGQPVAGIEMALALQDPMGWVAEHAVGTDADGRFTLVNVPAGNGYWLYGRAQSCGERGAVSSRALKVGAPETSTDAGVVELEAGLRVSGRVVTSDGSTLPGGTQLRIIRENVQEAMFTTVAGDGTFSFTHVPRELLSLGPLLRTYRVSPANASYDFVNHTGLIGTPVGDTELELVLEPQVVEEEPSLPDIAAWQRYEELMKAPLRGREARR